jgi:hypothetical protein
MPFKSTKPKPDGPETEYHATPEYEKLHAENLADTHIAKARWAAMKEEYLERVITGREVHWPSLSAKYGMGYQVARNRASSQRWHDEVEKRRKEREDLLDRKMTERTLLVLDKLNEDFATSEEAIRKRHALFARTIQAKAIKGLNDKPIKSFTATELLRMLELGLREERFAFGLKETADLPPPPDAQQEIRSQYKPIMEQLGGHQKVQQIGTLLLRELSKRGGVITDAEPREGTTGDSEAEDILAQELQAVAPKKIAKPVARFKVGPRAAA